MVSETSPPAHPADLTAREAARRIARGELTAVELASACLERIEQADGGIRAWEFVDRDKALRQAEEADRRRGMGLPLGPLHGVPVAVKDIIDVRGMPCAFGSPVEAGRTPDEDATVVRRLRRAGAVILGKTVTTEFAYRRPGPTRNPHDPTRTPGGSSSGSAAAVAAGMVPLALASQTAGSVIRPASFCGVVGFKPSFGTVPRTGVLPLSTSLDHVGLFARSIEDAALIETIMGPDGIDRECDLDPGPLTRAALSEPPLAPVLAFVPTPFWERAEESTRAAFAELVETLGDGIDEVELPGPFAHAKGWHRKVMAAEMARYLGKYADRAPEQTSEAFRAIVAEGRGIPAPDYLAARDMREVLRAGLDEIFERYDAIVTPAAPGEAPEGLENTGDPVFCMLWTFTGLPAVTLPLMTGPAGLPLGVQLVGRYGDDARLLRTARWLVQRLSAAVREEEQA